MSVKKRYRMVGSNPNLGFPSKLFNGRYVFKEYDVTPYHTYNIAIYRDNKGKEYVAKMWWGSDKGKKYQELENEILAYELLGKLIRRHRKSIVSLFPDVSIPGFVGVYRENCKTIVLIDKVEGKIILEKSIRARIKHIMRAQEYLAFLSTILKGNEVDIVRVEKYKYALTFPALALYSFIKHPSLNRVIFSAFKRELALFSSVIKYGSLGLTHRDINSVNIISNRKGIALLDFQLFSLSIPEYDYAASFYETWKPEYGEEMNGYLKNSLNRTKSFMLYFVALYDLAIGTEKQSGEIQSYIDYLIENRI